jgi:carbamoyltransferase
LIDLKEDGSLAMDMSYFQYCEGLRMTNDKFAALFGGPARNAESEISQREMDIAASIQAVTEEVGAAHGEVCCAAHGLPRMSAWRAALP